MVSGITVWPVQCDTSWLVYELDEVCVGRICESEHSYPEGLGVEVHVFDVVLFPHLHT
jgi:hypothetical protein